MHDTLLLNDEIREDIYNNENSENNLNENGLNNNNNSSNNDINNNIMLVGGERLINSNIQNIDNESNIRNYFQIQSYNVSNFWKPVIDRLNDAILPIITNIRTQLPYIKFMMRIFIILTLTILPLINELHSVLPLVRTFIKDNNWLLVPMSMNRQIINNDLLLRLNSQEYNILFGKNYYKFNDDKNLINLNNLNNFLNRKNRYKGFKSNYIDNNICNNNEIGLFSIINESNFHNLYYKNKITINIPLNWCSKNLNNNNFILNTRGKNFNKRYLISTENGKTYSLSSLKLYVNTYKYKPTYIFKIISLLFVIFRWCMLVSRMILQLWNYNIDENNFHNNSTQSQFISEFKSLVSFCIFYIWSLSCVYLLFGLTTNRCSPFPKIALHEAVQWLLWVCVIITAICFKMIKLPILDNYDNSNNTLSNNNTENINNESINNNIDYNTRKKKIFIQHLFSIISCCGFGFSLSGSVLLLSTRITSPWITSCFITIISQCLDLLLRSYLGLIIENRIIYEKKIRYFKYVFPAYLLKDEEKINCNKNGQREWIVKCAYNSQPPPLIFKHTFISIRLTRISTTFFSISDVNSSELNKISNNILESKLSNESSNVNLNNQSINCMICYENQSNIVFSPCLHSGICDICIDELMKWTVCKLRKSPCCHLCRCPIEIAWQLNIDNDNIEKNNFYSEKCIEVIYPKLQINDDSINKYNF